MISKAQTRLGAWQLLISVLTGVAVAFFIIVVVFGAEVGVAAVAAPVVGAALGTGIGTYWAQRRREVSDRVGEGGQT
jgi:hypothetical protein